MNDKRAETDTTLPLRVAVSVVEYAGQYLIGQRPAGATLAGLWEFPGGKLLDGETPEDAAVRECREETGLQVLAVGRHSTVVEQYPHGVIEVTFVLCRPEGKLALPLAPFRWVAAADLATYEFPAANAVLIQQILAGNALR
jgi:8-oxo-dGTP diphosphatase